MDLTVSVEEHTLHLCIGEVVDEVEEEFKIKGSFSNLKT